MTELAPIILFVYNRLQHTTKTIEALLANDNADNSNLIIFSDGPKNLNDSEKVEKVRSYIRSLSGFKSIEIIERDKNLGLANSVISGVTQVLDSCSSVIVLEDDIVTSPNFLNFMNNALNQYRDKENIFSISGYSFIFDVPTGYNHNVYLTPRASSWGWATWKDRWEKVDWDISDYNLFIKDDAARAKFNRGGEDLTPMLSRQIKGVIDSWAIRWGYAHYKNNAYCLCPIKSLVRNLGADGTGTHMKKTNKFLLDLDTSTKFDNLPINIEINDKLLDHFKKAFKQSILRRAINKFHKYT